VPADFRRAPLAFLSRAPQDSLERLPGIGPGLARRIAAYRREHPLRTWEDLDRVPGIGPSRIARLREAAAGRFDPR
jgi:competence protein ComEA